MFEGVIEYLREKREEAKEEGREEGIALGQERLEAVIREAQERLEAVARNALAEGFPRPLAGLAGICFV